MKTFKSKRLAQAALNNIKMELPENDMAIEIGPNAILCISDLAHGLVKAIPALRTESSFEDTKYIHMNGDHDVVLMVIKTGGVEVTSIDEDNINHVNMVLEHFADGHTPELLEPYMIDKAGEHFINPSMNLTY